MSQPAALANSASISARPPQKPFPLPRPRYGGSPTKLPSPELCIDPRLYPRADDPGRVAWFTPKILPDSFHPVGLTMSPKRIARILAWIGAVVLCAVMVVAVKVVRHRSAKQQLASNAAIVPDALLHAHNFHWTQMKGDENQWV
jgi:hypothetical protein